MNKTDIWNMNFPEWACYMKEINLNLCTGNGNKVYQNYQNRVKIFENGNRVIK